MTKVTFYRGLREIGGTVVAVETEKAVCLFDFGFSVTERADSKVSLREGHIPQDYVRAGMLPPLDGIYDESCASELGLRPYSRGGKEYFFIISHMHIDHMGGLDMLSPHIPVYMSSDSLRLYRRLAAQGELTYREHRNCIGVGYGQCFSVGDISIKAVQIDHDCIGACGYLIDTPEGSICYTGDYRFHGYHPEITEAFAETCRGADMLITEGVTVSSADVDMLACERPEVMRTERDLLSETEAIMRSSRGLVVINPYNRNVERVHELIDKAASCGRRLVLDAAQADYVKSFYPDDTVYVYAETIHGRSLPGGAGIVDRSMLLESPESYVLQLDYGDQYELFDLQGAASAYIHMDGAPLGDYDPSFAKMKLQLAELDIPYHYLSLGGHAYPYFLRHMIDVISPRILVPLHSKRPEQVNSEHIAERILPYEGQTIEL